MDSAVTGRVRSVPASGARHQAQQAALAQLRVALAPVLNPVVLEAVLVVLAARPLASWPDITLIAHQEEQA